MICTFNFVSRDAVQALYIDIFDSSDEQKLLSYILVPWQEMYEKKLISSPDGAMVIPNHYLYTVSPFAVIYRSTEVLEKKSQMAMAEKLSASIARLFNYEQIQTVIYSRDGFSTNYGLQVMSLTEYPWYVEIHAASPGSQMEGFDALKADFPARMIHLTVMPDQGKGWSNWLISL